jgi:diguanylate cyclase
VKTSHPERCVDIESLQLDSALRLIAQSGQPALNDVESPQAYVQSVIDALCSLSSHDALTGLANRRSFGHAVEQELDRVARSGDVALLLMVDIDHFKKVNDTHGHLVGDEVLKQVARRILDCVRPMDTVARFGGEEFAVVLPNCSYSYGNVVAERIRESMANAPIAVSAHLSFPITVSVGGAYAPQWIRSEPAIWIERADRQLYRAKHEGRNTVCLEQTIDTVVSTEEKELLYGAMNFEAFDARLALANLDTGHGATP